MDRRVKIHDSDPEHQEAFEKASWKVNELGMKKFKNVLDILKAKEKDMDLIETEGEENNIQEKFTGKLTKTYTGLYKTDGFSCTYSFYNRQRQLCRHLFFYRKQKEMPLFHIDCFDPSLRIDCEVDSATNKRFATVRALAEGNLASPGMEYMISVQQKKVKTIKENVKYMQAFECAKVCTDYLSQYNQEEYDKNYEALQNFTQLMRNGLPDDLTNLLQSLCNNEKSSTSGGNIEDDITETSSPSEDPPLPSLPEWVRALPQNH